MAENRITITSDLTKSDFLDQQVLANQGLRSTITAPLVVGNRKLGTLNVGSKELDAYDAADETLVLQIASILATSIDNQRLLKETQTAFQETATLYRVSQALAQMDNEREMFELVLTEYLKNLDLQQGGVLLIDGEGLYGTLQALMVAGEIVEPGLRLPISGNPSYDQLIETKKPVAINDARLDPRLAPVQETITDLNIRSLLLVPIIMQGQVIGALGADATKEPHTFTEREIALVQAMSDQLGVALEKRRLLAGAEILYTVGRRINEATGLQQVVAAVAEQGPISIINRAVLEIFERNTADEVESLLVAANWHSGLGRPPTEVGTRYVLAESPIFNHLLTTEPVFYGDVQNDERRSPEARARLQQLNIKSAAVLPLSIGARQIGVLILESEKLHDFSDNERRLFIPLAQQVAVAVENQRLLTATQAALDEVQRTQRRYTVQAWEAYQRRNLTQDHERIRYSEERLAGHLPAEVKEVVAQKKALVATRPASPTSTEPGAQADPSTEPASNLIVPLTIRDEVIGVLGLQETDQTRKWLPEEVALVEAIAREMAQAAEGLRLLDETQQRAARERRVNEIGDKNSGRPDLRRGLKHCGQRSWS